MQTFIRRGVVQAEVSVPIRGIRLPRSSRVCVGAADKSELERINTELFFEHETIFQCTARIVALVGAAGLFASFTRLEKLLEVALLIVVTEASQALGISLVLMHLDDWFGFDAPLEAIGGKRTSVAVV